MPSVLEQKLLDEGHVSLSLFHIRYQSTGHAVDAARARAYRMAKRLGIRVTTAVGDKDLYVTRVR